TSGSGVPVFPVAVPGAAVAPGNNTCNLTKGPPPTTTGEPVLGNNGTPERSAAVTVWLPAVLNVVEIFRVPFCRAIEETTVAAPSVDVISTERVEGTRFQNSSVDLTVILKATPETRSVAVPVFPVDEPGSAVSPGINTKRRWIAPAFTITFGLVLAVI